MYETDFRKNGWGLFNHQRFKDRIKAIVKTHCDLIFENDYAYLGHTTEDMQWIVNDPMHLMITVCIKRTVS